MGRDSSPFNEKLIILNHLNRAANCAVCSTHQGRPQIGVICPVLLQTQEEGEEGEEEEDEDEDSL